QIEIGSGGWTDGDEDKTGLRGYVGLTIPGGWPLFVGGSTGSLAFAFTNLHGDLADLVVVETDPNDPSRYLTPEGSEPFGIVTESIAVRNEETRTLDVRTTRWGPIVAIDADGRPLALRWIVQDPLALVGDGADLARELSAVRTVAEAVRVVSRAGGPPLNVVVADAHGDVAYAVMGALPTRRDGRMSKDWRDARTEWPISLDAKPEPIVAPASGVVFNANNRSLSLDAWSAVGRQPGAPSRAFRIRELLAEHLAGPASDVDERAMLEMQFDAHAYRYSYLAAHFSAALQDASDPDLRALGGMFADWDGKASANSRVYPIAYEISRVLEADLIGRLALPALEARQAKSSESADADEPGPWWFRVPVRSRDTVRAALAERPDHLLPAGFDEWDDYLRDVAAYAIAGMGGAEVAARTGRTWGERNKLAVRHPLSDALPSSFAWLKDRLSLPEVQQAGAGGTIHVTGRTFGASNRLVVSPGREEFGVLQLPGGRSGIPMSRLSQNRFEAWATGEPDPLLARDPQLEWLLNPSDRE
ncbi:MAG: penicillin acylase family protein, partial [Planctomycetota bacterium]